MTAPIKFLCWILLIACMMVLAKNILFKHNKDYRLADVKKAFNSRGVKHRFAKANLEPFTTIKLFYNSNRLRTGYKVGNLAGNVAGFIPLGILLPLLFGFRRGIVAVTAVFLVSLGFEMAQLFFALGIFDVDDLILNTAGGLIGYSMYWIVRSIGRLRSKREQQDGFPAIN